MSISVKNRRGERGTVLVVVVALLALVGAILTLGIGAFHTADDQEAIRRTGVRQDFLMRELSAYVQLHNQLPCPADPAVAPSSSGFGVARTTCTAPGDWIGLIPFRTLHLSDYDARDGWNHYMTYRISPVLANSISAHDQGTTPHTDQIFMRCRRFPWFDGGQATATITNIYPPKARFCCPPDNAGFDNTTDLRVLTASGGTAVDGIGGRLDAAAPLYDTIDTPWSGGGDLQQSLAPVPAGAGNEEMFAVAVISHGKNGVGAYIGGSAAPLGGNVGADERANFTVPAGANSNIIVDHPFDMTAGPTYFDDIVVWRTQISLMATLNNASCYIPWR